MAPTYSRSQIRRQNRTGLVDHDVYEGLPVRQWRRDYVTVAPPPSQETTASQNDIWAIELPYGMPKDSHLLPQHSQDLLRAARSGRIYKRPAPPEEEEADPEIIIGDKPEKKDEEVKDKGFMAKAWKQIPRHMEASDLDYLAKRRKGLIPAAVKGAAPGPTLIKTTVKRTDAVGNEYVQDVVVPQGQHVEGEVIAQTVIPDPHLIDPAVAQATPPKRKGPISRKKMKGPGRGRKKKVLVPPTSVPVAVGVDGVAPAVVAVEGVLGQDGVKAELDPHILQNVIEDTEMGEGSNAQSDDDEGDDGDDGEDGDDEEGDDNHASPSKPPRTVSDTPMLFPTMQSIPDLDPEDTHMSSAEFANPPNLLTVPESLDNKNGSPLKNVALTVSTLNSPAETPNTSILPELSQLPYESESVEQAIEEQVIEMTPLDLPLAPPEPTVQEVAAAAETLQEEEEEEEMLLDIIENLPEPVTTAPDIVEPIAESESIVESETVQATEEVAPVESVASVQVEEKMEDLPVAEWEVQEKVENLPVAETGVQEEVEELPVPETRVQEKLEELPVAEDTVEEKVEELPIVKDAVEDETVKAEPVQPEETIAQESVQEQEEEDDDDFPDLLGGLEKSLEKKSDV